MTMIKPMLVPTPKRMRVVADLFGNAFPLKLEPFTYHIAGLLCNDYNGGYWEFYLINNETFFMCPDTEDMYIIDCPNTCSATLSAEGFGITACLYAYSQLSFETPSPFSRQCAEQFHGLRAYALQHRESKVILAAID